MVASSKKAFQSGSPKRLKGRRLRIFLDISRLIYGAWQPMPTGIDRVERAYARHWLKKDPTRVTFMLRGPVGPAASVPHKLVAELVEALDTGSLGKPGWKDAAKPATQLARVALTRLSFGRGLLDLSRDLRASDQSVHLLVSHLQADNPRPIAALKRKGVKFVPLIHDLIPLTHPEYVSPSGAQRHAKRLETFAKFADGIIVNSNATLTEILPHLPQGHDKPPIITAPLGVERLFPDPNFPAPAQPYFVCIGTIEPRKNHLLLLNTWRVLQQRLGVHTPKLILIGRRGWENENILDMLERCPALVGVVREYQNLPDNAVARLLWGARALLFPSFTEGYGLPLAEALALGVPAICSDLPALREVGGEAPEYLDPLDGLGWRRLILGFIEEDSRVREAQLRRIERWTSPSWEDHFSLVDPWVEEIAKATGPVNARRFAPGPLAAPARRASVAPSLQGS
jgi:glycosyltransferase involved in cell wall biosynthesis